MKVEFLIHGVLSHGQTFWKDTDTDYLQRFYVPHKENVVMEVEAIGKSVYYNYLRYNNISATERNGAYFGMTVRIDGEMYTDLKNMYWILDMLFEKWIVGKLLKPLPSGYIYTFDRFEERAAELKEIEEAFVRLAVASMTSGNDLIPLTGSITSVPNKIRRNVLECSRESAVKFLTAGATLCISPQYPLSEMQQQYDKVLSDLNELRKASREREEKLTGLNDSLNKRLIAANQTVSRLDAELADMKERQTAQQAEKSDAKSEEAEKVLIFRDKKPASKFGRLNWMLFANIILVVVIIALIVAMANKPKPQPEEITPTVIETVYLIDTGSSDTISPIGLTGPTSQTSQTTTTQKESK